MRFVARILPALLLMAATATIPSRAVAGTAVAPRAAEEALSRYASARLLEERGRDQEALAEYERVLALVPGTPGVERRVSELSARLGETQRSLEFARRALTRDSADARARWLEGSALFNLEQAPEALAALEAAVALDSGQVDYWRTLAHVAEQLERVDAVARAWRHAVWLDEDDGESWFQLAAAEARLGRFGAADTALAEAMAINPLRPGILFLHGWVEESQGHPGQAVELYRHHLQVHADDQTTRRRLVNLLVDQHRFAEAYAEARKVTRARPEDPEALEVEADLALRTGRQVEGQRQLDRLRALDPDDPDIVGRIAGVLEHHGRAREGVVLADRWAAAHPGDYRGAMLVARARLLAGEPDAAAEAARRAVALAPDSLAPRALVARVYQSRRRYAEAAEAWEGVVSRFPGNSAMALDLAFCREQLGDMKRAEEAVRDVLRREPDNAPALNFLGYLFADHGSHLEEAERLIGRALEQDPQNGAYVDSMGWVYYRLGRLAEARARLEEAVRLTGGDPVVREHLGDVYKDLNLMDLARDQYRLSLAGDRANARVRGKLEGIR
ncbi:MAG: tetratricopeptide repeat protein [Candidatus Eisenbacteria bacterium]|nr:tetratricopeptide repeat protein [Candidatus Eisenbacteria bacterium]